MATISTTADDTLPSTTKGYDMSKLYARLQAVVAGATSSSHPSPAASPPYESSAPSLMNEGGHRRTHSSLSSPPSSGRNESLMTTNNENPLLCDETQFKNLPDSQLLPLPETGHRQRAASLSYPSLTKSSSLLHLSGHRRSLSSTHKTSVEPSLGVLPRNDRTLRSPLHTVGSSFKCFCQYIPEHFEPGTCHGCQQPLEPIRNVERQRLALLHELETFQLTAGNNSQRNRDLTIENNRLRQRVHFLEQEVAKTRGEVSDLCVDLESLNEKYVKEIEKSSELQESKQAVEDELEELSGSLFEQANSMVAEEKKKMYETEQKLCRINDSYKHLKNELRRERWRNKELNAKLTYLRKRIPNEALFGFDLDLDWEIALSADDVTIPAFSVNGNSSHHRQKSRVS